MQPTLNQLIEEIEATKVFRRNKKDVKIKILVYYTSSDFLSGKRANSCLCFGR